MRDFIAASADGRIPLLLMGLVYTLFFAASAFAESFYERKPADVFHDASRDVQVEVISTSQHGTVQARLSNGLVVLMRENHTAPIALVQVAVKTGSIYEQEYLGAGISHYFEHLMQAGTTTTRTEEETREILQSLGNISNAYTSYDHTSYFIKTTKDEVGTAIELLADWMINTQITEEEFSREMEVIQREYERAYSQAERVFHKMVSENMFNVHPVRHPILGYEDVRVRLNIDDMRLYRARMYVPNNMIVVAVGDFAWEDALEKIRAAFDGFHMGITPAITLPVEPPQTAKRVMRKTFPDLNRTMLAMSYRTVPLTHPDLYALDVMAAVLGRGESSRLVQKLRNELRLVQSVGAWSWTPGFDAGQFAINANIPENKNLPAVQQHILDELDTLRREPVEPHELQRVKNSIAAEHVYSQEQVETQVRMLVSSFLAAGDPDFDEQYVAGIQQVTPEDIKRVANTYFPDSSLCITILEPDTVELQEEVEAEIPQASDVQKVTLDNGLRVLLKRNPNVPVVAYELYFEGGLRTETPQTSGISNFAATVWQRGTKTRPVAKLADELEYMGASLSTAAGNYTLYLRASSLAKDFDKMLEIVSDVVLDPAFDEEETERMRQLILHGIRQRDDSIYSQTQRLLNSTFYGETNPYGLYKLGEIETVSRFTAQQLAEYYKTYARAPNAVLAVYGDIDPAEAAVKIAQAFAELPAEPAPAISEVAPVKLVENNTVTAARARKDAAAVYFAFPGVSLTNEGDRYAFQMFNVILSGGSYPSGMLHTALRGEGLVYEVHAYNVFGLDPRHFQVQAITNPATVDTVKKIVLEKIEKIKQGEFTGEEFERARKIIINEDIMSRQTNSDQAMSAAINELYGLGYDFDDRYPDQIRAVARGEVIRIANKYFNNYVCAVASHQLDETDRGETDVPVAEE